MATNSRYDFMTEGTVKDEITGSYYPDPLSLNYLNFKMTSLPIKDTLTESKIGALWSEAEAVYGVPYYEDLVLTLNGVPHKNHLSPGDELYFPGLSDITTSFNKKGE